MQPFTTLTAIAAPLPLVNVDTDKIIPARHLKTIKRSGLGVALFETMRYHDDGRERADFILNREPYRQAQILIAGENFGCGSSREHAPIAMGAAGVEAVVADSFARIFFRNCVATGELYPYDARERLCDVIKTGDVATLDFDNDTLTVNGQTHSLKPLGAARPVIEAGGVFNYARQSGMIPSNL